MKLLLIFLITILISTKTSGQDYYKKLYDSLQPEYENFIKALLSNDTIAAKIIQEANVKTQPIQERAFSRKNFPVHVFKMNIATLKNTIVNLFKIENDASDNINLRDVFYFYSDTNRMQIFFVAETSKDTIFSKNYFSTQLTSNDIYLTSFHRTWISKLYYSNDHHLKYTTDFAVKLKMIDSNLTQLNVVALNPEVVNGMSIGIHGPQNEYQKVEPTTIEEYSILLSIADKLGDKTLLPLILPDK